VTSPSPSDEPTRLELYKLFVEMADRTSARRAGTNTFFVTLHSALASIVGLISATHTPKHTSDRAGFLTVSIVGFVLSLTWWTLLRYYRRLNTAKFSVINSMESTFPIRPYTEEWQNLHPSGGAPQQSGLRRWLRRQSHREASLVEQVVPLLFAAIYIVLGVTVVSR
jgi:hypothetical protein